MTRYRRARIRGATYFFTVALACRAEQTLVDEIGLLRAACATTWRERPVICNAMVILPDHLHAVWTLPEGDADFSTRWRLIKTRFSRALGRSGRPGPSQRTKQELGIWQRRFWEHRIRDDGDLALHLHYCWTDPVRHGLAQHPAAWPHSSIHRDIRRGLTIRDWCRPSPDGAFGGP